MSLLYKALRKSAEREQERPPKDARVPLAPAVPIRKRRSSASRIVLLALMVVAALGAGGLFLWPQVERALGPRTTAALLDTASDWLAELTGGPMQPPAQPSATQTAARQTQPQATQPAATETAAAPEAAATSGEDGGAGGTGAAATAASGPADADAGEAPAAGGAPDGAGATPSAGDEPATAGIQAGGGAGEEAYRAAAATGGQEGAPAAEARGDPIPLAPSTEPEGAAPLAAAAETAASKAEAAAEGEPAAVAATAEPVPAESPGEETPAAAEAPEAPQTAAAAQPRPAGDGGQAAEVAADAAAVEADEAPAQTAEAPTGDGDGQEAMASIPGEEPLVSRNEAAVILREIENPTPDRRTTAAHGDGAAGATQSAARTGGASVDGGGSEVRIDRSLDSGDNAALGRVEVVNETAPVMDRFREAHRLMRAGHYGRALAAYEGLIERMPRDRTALLGRASALQQLGRTTAAIGAYRAVLARYPGDIGALTSLVGLLGAGASQPMIERLHRLYSRNEDYAPAAAQLAMAYARMEQPAQAISLMRRAVDLRPESLVYQANLAILLDRAGQAGEAVRAYERVLALAANAGAGRMPVPVESVRERLRYLGMN